MASLEVAGRQIALTNVDKVLWPETGTTKGEVIDYYVDIAPAMLPHLLGRPVTRKRWPNGVQAGSFFEKNLAASAPDWLDRRRLHHSDRVVVYPVFHTAADLAWLGQQAALEAHVPQWTFDGDEQGKATRIVFDLDPGEGVDLDTCATVACEVRAMITDIGLTAHPLTSGSKGIHLYVPLEKPVSSSGASTVAKRVATLLEEKMPDLVTASMSKALRPGKIFLDWSQNNGKKTTIAPYSLRGRDRPTVAAPRTWDELSGGGLAQLSFEEVLARFHRDGDLLAGLDPEPEASTITDSLGPYRGKRTASRTPEPVPTTSTTRESADPIFVIQEHHARRLHYDFRLERDGVLVSWAVPKNLPTDEKKNHLAVHTEDHPMDYASFEGTIPQGEYGGGEVSVWDHGTFITEKWRDDEVIVELAGERVAGRYALIRTDRDQWLVHRMTSRPQPTRTELPRHLRPMLASAGTLSGLEADEWSFEGKWDGVRIVATLDHGDVVLESRTGQDLTRRYAGITALAADLSDHAVVLDGEAVVYRADGVTSFQALQDAHPDDVQFICFDILHLDGTDLTGKKFTDRRKILELLLTGLETATVSPLLPGTAAGALSESERRGWEGIVAKRRDSTYEVGRRSTSWIKVKNWRTQEVVIGGWRAGKGSRTGSIGSLLLGIPSKNGLHYVGRVGTGFTERQRADLLTLLRPAVVDESPFDEPLPTADRRDATWVAPTVVGEVRFFEWTDGGSLRHPSWRGLREDKTVEDVHRED
ncbi:ATP-dependent DNA ligase [Rhodococcus sp. BP-149]|uniref:ATP-dependent DNA ligase n=1 Tax=unclassified Rhodococcus (in: high G+C Gram-positive bacteria) TaxID=192944 RepID=UPI001C9AB1DA|nr:MULTISPECIES: ATP-dependent DNA ligase [unclassified Rhodococcus (in: high G+C Gram-positive bacteria)]MBY6684618.1 ATP-dependent DNA ligase [Rhodococcus sp. BP-288]MBY6695415.1 ATP-dependent DNA ligase [Rhodococcus sp. BP-188]MBY6698796.1 ATP-dependent DNA ligase [Rhodococcus sp. BP-285]MBY6701475.1 ATP-dependent DNA ligase [Rhodococcus sp. BP-283]MBY6712476.1 ATP-dependent DNA ligase [Rhodococcus sp. BP-160]